VAANTTVDLRSLRLDVTYKNRPVEFVVREETFLPIVNLTGAPARDSPLLETSLPANFTATRFLVALNEILEFVKLGAIALSSRQLPK